jgi:sulfur-carrier protein adenylyltransferase/sulfurtransferase
MKAGPSSLVCRLDASKAELEAWVGSLRPEGRALSVELLKSRYPNRDFIAGWRLDVEFSDEPRQLDLLIDARFPWSPSRFALVDPPDFLTWPHVEKDGVLCLLRDGAWVDHRNPALVAVNLLVEAVKLIEDSAAGRNAEDFREEFVSYWYWGRTKETPIIYSLVDLTGPSRTIRVLRGQGFFLLTESEAAAVAWLTHRFGERRSDWSTEAAIFALVERLPLPREYPSKPGEMREFLRHSCPLGAEILDEVIGSCPAEIVVVLAGSSQNGRCAGAVVISGPPAQRGRGPAKNDLIDKGFRPGRVPVNVVRSRYVAAAALNRVPVNRLDAGWIHGRDHDARTEKLRASKVAILGCGAIGAPIALKLAQAGVGEFHLVDPDELVGANVGRHPLGVPYVGQPKVAGLRDLITRNYPHVRACESYAKKWEQVVIENPKLLRSCDLIVSAMGDWTPEGALNEWHLAERRQMKIVYGWTEAHACAGHAVAIGREGGCFACGFGNDGQPLLRVTDWPRSALQAEPACGAVYQPFGPVELTHIEGLVAEVALDCLLGRTGASVHRVWAGRREVLEDLGGSWTEEWSAIAGSRRTGSFVEERAWPDGPCAECRDAAA